MSNLKNNSTPGPLFSESTQAVPFSDTVTGPRSGSLFMEGWIKLHRKIRENWIWQDPVKLRWWIDILLEVNHSKGKVSIGFEVYECEKGQSIRSLQGWASRWGVSRDTARNFLAMLEKDGMILHKSLGKSTQITVCNYVSYQVDLRDEQTISKRKANDEQTVSDTNKNDKKKKKDILSAQNFYSDQIESNSTAKYIDQYKKAVDLIFGRVGEYGQMDKILSIKNQLTYNQFELLLLFSLKNNFNLKQRFQDFDDYNGKYKPSTVYNSILKWMKNDLNKK